MSRRREDRIGSCLFCGAVLGIFIEGEQPKLEAHACPFGDPVVEMERNDVDDMLAELRATRNPDRE